MGKHRKLAKKMKDMTPEEYRSCIHEWAAQKSPEWHDKRRERARQHYRENSQRIKKKTNEYNRSIRKKVLDHYGHRCVCCGETKVEFLCIDHVNGEGNKHRLEINKGSGTPTYYWLIKNNYPVGFQVLCHNCNQAKAAYGYCPHQKENVSQMIIDGNHGRNC